MLGRVGKVVVTAAVVVLLGAVFLALAPFDAGPNRCGAPLFGAETEKTAGDQPGDTLAIPTCGDKGAHRLVYAAGLSFLGLVAIAGVAVSVASGDRQAVQAVAPASSSQSPGDGD